MGANRGLNSSRSERRVGMESDTRLEGTRLGRRGIIVGLLGLLAGVARVQADTWMLVPGYASDVKGEILDYNSADPDVRSSLLVRSLHEDRYIEWTQ